MNNLWLLLMNKMAISIAKMFDVKKPSKNKTINNGLHVKSIF